VKWVGRGMTSPDLFTMLQILRKKSFEKLVRNFSEFILRYVQTYLTIFVGKDIADILPLRLRLFHTRLLDQDFMLYAVVTLKDHEPDMNYTFRTDLGTIKFSGKELRVWVVAKTLEDLIEDLKIIAQKTIENTVKDWEIIAQKLVEKTGERG
jgi:hypothetical protein